VQRLRRLLARSDARRQACRFVIEGPTLLADALAAGATVEAVYAGPAGVDLPAVGQARERGIPVQLLAEGIVERVADTVTPQPVLAVVARVETPLTALRSSDLLVICVDIRDPGNAGTLLRAAEAAGAGGVVCCGGTVDVFNPKTVRASAGAIFHVPVAIGGDATEVLRTAGSWGLRRWAADANDGTSYDAVDLTVPTALVLGNEAHGFGGHDLDAVIDGRVRIPMHGRAESLNVAVAGAVLCFEAARQRRREARL
jgi:TrmH family RNA methyltransferase